MASSRLASFSPPSGLAAPIAGLRSDLSRDRQTRGGAARELIPRWGGRHRHLRDCGRIRERSSAMGRYEGNACIKAASRDLRCLVRFAKKSSFPVLQRSRHSKRFLRRLGFTCESSCAPPGRKADGRTPSLPRSRPATCFAVHHDAPVFEDVPVVGIPQRDVGVLLGKRKLTPPWYSRPWRSRRFPHKLRASPSKDRRAGSSSGAP